MMSGSLPVSKAQWLQFEHCVFCFTRQRQLLSAINRMEGFVIKGGAMGKNQWEREDFEKQSATYQIEKGISLRIMLRPNTGIYSKPIDHNMKATF